jgi:Beta-galactosidase
MNRAVPCLTLLAAFWMTMMCLQSVQAQELTLNSLRFESVKSGVNLIPNPSFERTNNEAVPEGWSWSARNTSAVLERSAVSHSGSNAVRITNHTEFGANVYGMLWRNEPIALQAGHRYVLSAWTRSHDPGIAWIGGGSNWQFRLQLPPTSDRWQRVWMPITPDEMEKNFVVRICTESPSSGLLIDDVKLEEGTVPTPDLPPANGAAAPIEAEPESALVEIEGDGPFKATFLAVCRTCTRVSAACTLDGVRLATTETLEPGLYRVVISGSGTKLSDRSRLLALLLSEATGKSAHAEMAVRFYSAENVKLRTALLRKLLPQLHTLKSQAAKAGKDTAYPAIQLEILDNFCGYVLEDATHGEVRRALSQLAELEPMALQCLETLRKALHGAALPRVPRWTGGPIKIAEGAFVSMVSTGKGPAKSSPVFFTGYGAFGQVRADIEKLPRYGANIIQIEIGPSALYPRAGEFNRAPIEEMQRLLKRAGAAGVAVNLLISPHYFPDWMLARHPHLRKRREGFLQYCIHAKESQEFLQRFVSDLIPPLRHYPALHSICLSNEPVNVEEPCEAGRADFHRYLADKYGTLHALNEAWGTHYAASDTDVFGAIPLPDPFASSPSSAEHLDYVLWNREVFANWHAMLAQAVHRAAPELPVHAKAMT